MESQVKKKMVNIQSNYKLSKVILEYLLNSFFIFKPSYKPDLASFDRHNVILWY